MSGAGLGKSNSGRDNGGPSLSVVDPLSRKLMRSLASGIGLAAEIYHHHKEKKATMANERDGNSTPTYEEYDQQSQYDGYDDYYSSNIPQQMHVATLQLDETHDQSGRQGYPPYPESEAQLPQLPQLAESLLRNRLPELALPVLITQRRPGKRSRGFVRAYAPLLNDIGIDQKTFLDFIDDLNKAVQPNGLIQVLNLASIAGLASPDHFTILISVAIQLATNIGDEIHSRTKTNNFLDKINDSFFAPRGLIAVVMTWKPSQSAEMITMANFDMNSLAAPNSESSRIKKFKHKLDPSSGVSSFEWPETAPLISPELDDLATDGGRAKKLNAIKRSSNFVEEYIDRRARAKWAGDNPQSIIANAGPKETSSSRYSDPNHPASSGDPLALVTGGRVKFPSLPLGGRLGGLGGGNNEQTSGSGGRSSSSGGGLRKTGTKILPLISGGMTLLQKDVLYLMIANRPTQQQVVEASAILRSSQHV